MNMAALLAAASIAALVVGTASEAGPPPPFFSIKSGPFPKGSKILYNQNSNNAGTAVPSQNFTGGSSAVYSSQGADEFVVPRGRTWQITQVDVTGVYYQGSGPPTSEGVTFYKNANGYPGEAVKNGSFNNLNGGIGPDFTISLPGSGLKLKSGTYWISVVANMDLEAAGAWAWQVNGVRHGKLALWRNPNGGFETGCTNWSTLEDCFGYGPDLMFALRGTSK
jgi:hypothetical protein